MPLARGPAPPSRPRSPTPTASQSSRPYQSSEPPGVSARSYESGEGRANAPRRLPRSSQSTLGTLPDAERATATHARNQGADPASRPTAESHAPVDARTATARVSTPARQDVCGFDGLLGASPPEVRVRVGCQPAIVVVSLCDAPANPVPFSGVRVMTYVAGARSAPVSRRPLNVMPFGPFLPATVSRPVGTVRVHCGLPMLPRVGATRARRAPGGPGAGRQS